MKTALSFARTDWLLFLPACALTLLGILTMSTFGVEDSLAPRQFVFLCIGAGIFLLFSRTDMRFLRRTSVALVLYGMAAVLLIGVLLTNPLMGARSWFDFGIVSFQPADFAKFALLILLAKYLSRRHVEIADIRHIVVSGIYVGIVALLVLVQPDLGTAIILGAVWLALMLVSGISKKHLALLALALTLAGAFLWFQGLESYQRARIVSFINPAGDIQGAGYSAYQARIAVGSGEWFGKGIGYGSQSKLRFLPEYQTDFIFAAYAEEWGFVGVVLLFLLHGVLFMRLADIAKRSAANFDAFFTLGVLVLLLSHFTIHTGINLGLLPVTGTTTPFMSSGGSHLLLEFGLLGIVASLSRQARAASRDALQNEYVGG